MPILYFFVIVAAPALIRIRISKFFHSTILHFTFYILKSAYVFGNFSKIKKTNTGYSTFLLVKWTIIQYITRCPHFLSINTNRSTNGRRWFVMPDISAESERTFHMDQTLNGCQAQAQVQQWSNASSGPDTLSALHRYTQYSHLTSFQNLELASLALNHASLQIADFILS